MLLVRSSARFLGHRVEYRLVHRLIALGLGSSSLREGSEANLAIARKERLGLCSIFAVGNGFASLP